MPNIFRVVLMFLIVVYSDAFGSDSDYLNRVLPPGINLGMTGAQLPVLPNTIRRPVSEGNQNPTQNYDLIQRVSPATFSWLYIRDDKLVGYMRITKPSLLSADQQQAEHDAVLPSSAAGFAKEADEKALRAGPNLEPIMVTATKWKSKSSDLAFYTVITDAEITAIAFDPAKISKDIFLASPLLKKTLEAEAKQIKQQLKTASPRASPNPNVQVLQSTPTPSNSAKQAGNLLITQAVKEKPSSSSFPIVLVAIIATLVGAIVFLLRRK